jgi:predicted deacylase
MDIPHLIDVPAGTCRKELLRVDLGQEIGIPCTVVRGREAGPTLLVTAGVHGAEYASIAAAHRIAGIDPDGLSGTVVVLPIVNRPSFQARSIYINPIDGKNLNRVFPGAADGTFSERLAFWLCNGFMRHADAYVDLHGGDLIEALTPFSIFHRDHQPSRELATVFGLPYLVEGSGSGSSYTAASAMGVAAVLAEAGGQGRWPEEAVELLFTGSWRVMQHLRMVPGEAPPVDARLVRSFAWQFAEVSGCWYPRVAAGDSVAAGESIGTVKDLLGDELLEIRSASAGTVLFSVTSMAINVGDPLVGIAE